jgi:hypothetical protein
MESTEESVDTSSKNDTPCDSYQPNATLSEGSNKGGEECTPPNFIPHENVGSVWERDWRDAYASCPIWGGPWKKICGNDGDWPHGFKRFDSLIYQGEKLCVPSSLQEHIIRSHHDSSGHLTGDKLWDEMEHRYAFADISRAKNFVSLVGATCYTCQACNRPTVLHGPIEYTLIPPKCMVSVALDLFKMPLANWRGREYNFMALCVDRHSGWIVASAHMEKGLTGAMVAEAMLLNAWRPFGIPSIISSDRGSHFVGAWWKTMCAHFGIRQAFSHAYHHQANGRAEKAGQQVMEILRKLHVHQKICWVEALPRVLDMIHDTKGEGGLSPYEILFGRQRPKGGIPYEPPP